MKQKRVYPNFNKEVKWQGIIEYKTILILGIYSAFIWFCLRIFLNNLLICFYITFILTIPVFIIFYANIGQENMYDMLKVILKYVFSTKIYLFNFGNKKYKMDI